MKRALIVKLGAIGDVVMAIPAARALQAEGYAIDWVCGRAASSILQLYPWINVVEADDRALLSGKPGAIFSLWRRLLRAKYDVVATLYYDSRYRILTLPVRASRKFLLSTTKREFALLPGRHHTDEYARVLRGAKDDVRPQALAPLLPETMPESPLARGERARVVMIAAGARNAMRDDALRRWPVESYIAVARELQARGHEIVLAGGPDDRWASPYFEPLGLVDMTAKLSLVEMVGLLNSADVVLTHDTGPLHLAGITRAGIVAVFGPVDPHGRLPQRHNSVALWGGAGFACRPCYDGRDYAPCSNNLCMQQVTPGMVVGEVETLIAARREGKPLLPRVRVPKQTEPLVQIGAGE
ncbi:glycosyltransferase family 9 protein [Granulicella cerasi]|uniref:Glycosyltransferase family 9 protein n=1 Tax=Granulicella cerasi TaxID=741063 RepID=A0ABW1ZBR1_9BACT|nr:glycosyltransferase family 9 protein [Granulicella cerasi]